MVCSTSSNKPSQQNNKEYYETMELMLQLQQELIQHVMQLIGLQLADWAAYLRKPTDNQDTPSPVIPNSAPVSVKSSFIAAI